MCVMMFVEVIARIRGKRATFGIPTIGGRSIGDVRDDGTAHEVDLAGRRRRRGRRKRAG